MLALVVGGLLSACGDDTPEAATGTSVTSAGAHDGEHAASSPVPEGARRVRDMARSLAFEPGEIAVEAGDAIAIVLTSENERHDFVIDEFEAHVSADAGETAVGGFRAHGPGRYAFYCSVAGHREAGMEGTLVVEAHG